MIKLRRRNVLKLSPEITPLIDVVFILLIFFLLTAVFTPYGMDLDLPHATSSEKRTEAEQRITLTQDEKIFLNGRPISFRELRTELEDLKPGDSVIIQGDKKISYGLFVGVMDVVRSNGNPKIILAAEHIQENPSQ